MSGKVPGLGLRGSDEQQPAGLSRATPQGPGEPLCALDPPGRGQDLAKYENATHIHVLIVP